MCFQGGETIIQSLYFKAKVAMKGELRQNQAAGEQSLAFGGFSKKLSKFLQVIMAYSVD